MLAASDLIVYTAVSACTIRSTCRVQQRDAKTGCSPFVMRPPATLLQPELLVKKRGIWTSFHMARARLYPDLSSLSAEVRSEAP